MGAPFEASDLLLMGSVYRVSTWASAALIVRGATGSASTDPVSES